MHLRHCADTAILVDVPDGATRARHLGDALRALAPAWLVDAVPGLTTLLVEYHPGSVSVSEVARALAAAGSTAPPHEMERREVVLPVHFGGDEGPDLPTVAAAAGMGKDALVDALCEAHLEVALVGHLPGLPYLTGAPASCVGLPRRPDPRPRVPAGTLGVAAGMLCVYPVPAPGGWHLVGATPLELFDPAVAEPCLLRPGDHVRLRRVTGPLPPREVPAVGWTGTTVEHRGHRRGSLRIEGPAAPVDLGRAGLGRLGVPRGGALDVQTWRAANLLVGNPPDTCALEVTLGRALIAAEGVATTLGVAGDARVVVYRQDGSRDDVGAWRTVRLDQGETVSVRPIAPWARAYVAIAGGIGGPAVLGSRTPLPGHPVPRVAHHSIGGGASPSAARLHAPAWLAPPSIVRVVPGPQAGALTPAGMRALTATPWQVSPASDRRGIRLDGPELDTAGAPSLPSQGMPPGAVQVTGAGRPILLLGDRGTTGGYAVVATVIAADLPGLGRLRPGAAVRLEAVDGAAAARLRGEQEACVATLPDHLDHLDGMEE